MTLSPDDPTARVQILIPPVGFAPRQDAHRMDFQDLLAFYNVAGEGSFSKAAIRMRTAQSALSRRVARLEQILGVKLLQRHGRGVRLTEQGTALFDRAQGLMTELELIQRDIQLFAEEPTGKVRLAMPPMTSHALGPPLALECRRRFPGVDLQLREGFTDLIHDWVSADEIDMGLMYSWGRNLDLRLEPVLDEPLVLLAPGGPGFEGQIVLGPVDVAQLAVLPLILPSRPNSMRLFLERVAAQHGIALNITMEVDGIHATRGFVAAGLGYTIFSRNGLENPDDETRLRAIPFRQNLSWQLALVRRERTRTPLAFVALEGLIREQIAILLASGRWRGTEIPGVGR